MSTPAGQRIARYEVQAVIGTGNFATVHRAFDERLGDTVAIKVLAENHNLDPDVRERFIAEGRVLRRVDSPHLVRVFDMGETDRDQPFLVLEYADRGTLAARIAHRRSGPGGWQASPDDLRSVARSLATASEALHEADLVHRDLSPGNVLLRSTGAARRASGEPVGPHVTDPAGGPVVAPDERLLLADLGLCKDLAAHSGLTAGSGTDGFRPPEQRGEPAQVDARADLWALSALLLWLATGRAPGEGSGQVPGAEVVALISRHGLPRRLGEVLAKSLSDDPAGRHPDVTVWLGEVQEALGPSAPGMSGPFDPSSTAPPAAPPGELARREPAPGSSQRTLALPTVALLVGLALGAGLALTLDGGGGSPSTETTDLGEGAVRVAAADGDAELALEGPSEVTVGEVAVFDMESEDVEDWVWIMPDGTPIPSSTQVSLEASTPGQAPVTLIGTSGSGVTLQVVHDLQAVEG